mgnify:CR=1 FL=1
MNNSIKSIILLALLMPSIAIASYDRIIAKDATDVYLPVMLRSSTTGMGLTGITSATLAVYYWRDGAASPVSVTDINGTLGSHADGGWKAIDATNMPGSYQFCSPDAAFATGSNGVTFEFIATGAIDKTVSIYLDATIASRLATASYTAERGTDSAMLASSYVTERGTDLALLASSYTPERGTDNALLALNYTPERGTDSAMLASSYTAERGTDNAALASVWTAVKAAMIDTTVSTRLATASYTPERGTDSAMLASSYTAERGTDLALLATNYTPERGTDTVWSVGTRTLTALDEDDTSIDLDNTEVLATVAFGGFADDSITSATIASGAINASEAPALSTMDTLLDLILEIIQSR